MIFQKKLSKEMKNEINEESDMKSIAKKSTQTIKDQRVAPQNKNKMAEGQMKRKENSPRYLDSDQASRNKFPDEVWLCTCNSQPAATDSFCCNFQNLGPRRQTTMKSSLTSALQVLPSENEPD